MYADCVDVDRRPHRHRAAAALVRVSTGRDDCGDFTGHAPGVHHQPRQPDRCADRARRHPRAGASGAAPARSSSSDEAYAEFTDEHFLSELDAYPNVVVGRTFAKAQGLAGLRVGAVVAVPDTIARLRRVAAALQHQRRRRGRAHRRARRSTPSRRGTARRSTRSREIVYADVPAARARVLAAATRTSCWSASATRRRPSSRRCAAAASSYAIARRSQGAPAASASPPALSNTPKRASRALEEVLCAAR